METTKTKEPIYMKWWVWIVIFLLSAVIINYTADLTRDYTYRPVLPPEVEVIPYRVEFAEEVTPVIADYNTPTTFLVGTDFPAGEYFVMANSNELGYVLLSRSRSLEASEIIWQKHFANHTIINLIDGQYLTTKNATLIPVSDAIIPNFENGVLTAGTYRVGIDIPPGVYTIFPLDNKTGFFTTATSSHHLHAHIIQSRNFSEPIIIALNIGDYITFIRAEIRK
jgi:hypothetical protein